jgi:predicted RNA binding protein YcfA (HicA-like mRNA interferase family)
LTASECIDRLVELGFTVRRRCSRLTILRRADRLVVVPHVGLVEPHMLEAILRSAGVGAEWHRARPRLDRKVSSSRRFEREGAPSHR